ncbi:hypothetical protein HPB49_020831 [Dermacentor silvarum]|uniref:Uncharacterized protein n=1 Tax=Dermacentor silvarum TaxID=543639 RepID=A0ACB8DKS9_DERSI|nr:hypothetical protein HPB49_020831 [Dermacentor silvarum]
MKAGDHPLPYDFSRFDDHPRTDEVIGFQTVTFERALEAALWCQRDDVVLLESLLEEGSRTTTVSPLPSLGEQQTFKRCSARAKKTPGAPSSPAQGASAGVAFDPSKTPYLIQAGHGVLTGRNLRMFLTVAGNDKREETGGPNSMPSVDDSEGGTNEALTDVHLDEKAVEAACHELVTWGKLDDFDAVVITLLRRGLGYDAAFLACVYGGGNLWPRDPHDCLGALLQTLPFCRKSGSRSGPPETYANMFRTCLPPPGAKMSPTPTDLQQIDLLLNGPDDDAYAARQGGARAKAMPRVRLYSY